MLNFIHQVMFVVIISYFILSTNIFSNSKFASNAWSKTISIKAFDRKRYRTHLYLLFLRSLRVKVHCFLLWMSSWVPERGDDLPMVTAGGGLECWTSSWNMFSFHPFEPVFLSVKSRALIRHGIRSWFTTMWPWAHRITSLGFHLNKPHPFYFRWLSRVSNTP